MIGIVIAGLIIFLVGVAIAFQGVSMWSDSRKPIDYLYATIVLLVGVLILWLAGAGVNEFFTHLK